MKNRTTVVFAQPGDRSTLVIGVQGQTFVMRETTPSPESIEVGDDLTDDEDIEYTGKEIALEFPTAESVGPVIVRLAIIQARLAYQAKFGKPLLDSQRISVNVDVTIGSES